MSGWTPEEIELREALVDEFSYVIPNEQPQALECVLKTFEVLERLGWRKQSPAPIDPRAEDFLAIGDDYGQVMIICGKCKEPNTPYRNTRQTRVGVVDNGTIAELIALYQSHECKS